MDGFLTEIRTFYSVKEIRENIEAEVGKNQAMLEDYSQWLGTLLRNPESNKNKDWGKKAAELQKVLKTGGPKSSRKAEKEAKTPTEWTTFRDIMLSADTLAEAEILFEAIEDLKDKTGKLEKATISLADLERYGLGKDLLYVTFIRNGIPEKIVFKPKKADASLEKLLFTADFLLAEQT
jgi:hypothetical protein